MSARVGDGRMIVTTAGTRLQLTNGGTGSAYTDPAGPIQSVAVMAETDNTGTVVVGGSAVVAAQATRRGIPLAAGQAVTFYCDDLADVYVDTTVNGDGVTFSWEAK
jgi:hypothetical protein